MRTSPPTDSSFYEIGKPKKGETIFISAASGAVGQIVVQLAKHEGLTVIGSVGDDQKVEYLKKELGCDKVFNYKKEKPMEALQRLAPDGIDIYYEVSIADASCRELDHQGIPSPTVSLSPFPRPSQNVGGETMDAALACMKERGRVGELMLAH